MTILTFYSRPGCHLCDRARAILAGPAAALGFVVQAVDIETDPALEARYGERIPVVEVDGHELLAWPFTAGQARDALSARVGVVRRRG